MPDPLPLAKAVAPKKETRANETTRSFNAFIWSWLSSKQNRYREGIGNGPQQRCFDFNTSPPSRGLICVRTKWQERCHVLSIFKCLHNLFIF